MSAPLFTEDRYSTSTDEDHEICDAEVSKITRQTPAQATTISIPPTRLVSAPSTLDYSPQGDPNQVAPPAMNAYSQNNSNQAKPSKIQISTLFQMVWIDTSMTYKIKHSMLVF